MQKRNLILFAISLFFSATSYGAYESLRAQAALAATRVFRAATEMTRANTCGQILESRPNKPISLEIDSQPIHKTLPTAGTHREENNRSGFKLTTSSYDTFQVSVSDGENQMTMVVWIDALTESTSVVSRIEVVNTNFDIHGDVAALQEKISKAILALYFEKYYYMLPEDRDFVRPNRNSSAALALFGVQANFNFAWDNSRLQLIQLSQFKLPPDCAGCEASHGTIKMLGAVANQRFLNKYPVILEQTQFTRNTSHDRISQYHRAVENIGLEGVTIRLRDSTRTAPTPAWVQSPSVTSQSDRPVGAESPPPMLARAGFGATFDAGFVRGLLPAMNMLNSYYFRKYTASFGGIDSSDIDKGLFNLRRDQANMMAENTNGMAAAYVTNPSVKASLQSIAGDLSSAPESAGVTGRPNYALLKESSERQDALFRRAQEKLSNLILELNQTAAPEEGLLRSALRKITDPLDRSVWVQKIGSDQEFGFLMGVTTAFGILLDKSDYTTVLANPDLAFQFRRDMANAFAESLSSILPLVESSSLQQVLNEVVQDIHLAPQKGVPYNYRTYYNSPGMFEDVQQLSTDSDYLWRWQALMRRQYLALQQVSSKLTVILSQVRTDN